jgi:hypothetical protein
VNGELKETISAKEVTIIIKYDNGLVRECTVYRPVFDLSISIPPVFDDAETQRSGWMTYRKGPHMTINLHANGLVEPLSSREDANHDPRT